MGINETNWLKKQEHGRCQLCWSRQLSLLQGCLRCPDYSWVLLNEELFSSLSLFAISAVCYSLLLLLQPLLFLSPPVLPLCRLLFLSLLFPLSYFFPKSSSLLVCEVCFHILLLFYWEIRHLLHSVCFWKMWFTRYRVSYTGFIKYNNLFLLILWQMQLIVKKICFLEISLQTLLSSVSTKQFIFPQRNLSSHNSGEKSKSSLSSNLVSPQTYLSLAEENLLLVSWQSFGFGMAIIAVGTDYTRRASLKLSLTLIILQKS